jgi:hypothetical protein
MAFNIQIPLEKCCEKFLKAYYGESITVSYDHPIGAIIHGLLEQPDHLYNNSTPVMMKNGVLYTFEINNKLSNANVYHISDNKIRVLNKMLKEQLQHDLLRFVMVGGYYGIQQKILINEFRLMYEIEEEDWSTDAMIKYIQRSKENFSHKSPLRDFVEAIKKNQGVAAVLENKN